VYAPRSLVCVVADEQPDTERTRGDRVPVYALRYAVAGCRWRRGSWHYDNVLEIGDGESLHDYGEQGAYPGQRAYAIAPVASAGLTQSGFWERITRAGAKWARGLAPDLCPRDKPPPRSQYSVEQLVLKGAPDIVQYHRAGKAIVWLSARNYFQ